MADYCDDDNLVALRPKILLLGVATWAPQITEATAVINRALETRWYRQACREYDLDYREYQFDPDLLLNATVQLTHLGALKSLELAYRLLTKDSPEADAFERQAENYRKLYGTELSEVLAQGLDYDWDDSGAIGDTEKLMPSMRRLKRA
ncbi:hypothetical protein LCGC14_1291730 [marine sediment metagenome]|uniref:Uncharacterized protein n=1 Tax=marine sediment metagenome TaxID=412755 RepID=A0A0F9LD15_9ZZZZ